VEGKEKSCTEDGYTAHKACKDCEYTEGKEVIKAGHKLIDVAEQENTCTEDGYTAHKACTECDYTEGKSVIEAGHGYKSVAEVPATKQEEGVKAHHECINCHKKFLIVDGEYVEVTDAELAIAKLPTPSGCGANATDVMALISMLCAVAFIFKKRN
jgi:ribosomal protein L32